MTFVSVGNCPQCGAPIYAPAVWHGIIPPPSTHTCCCSRGGSKTLDYTQAIRRAKTPEQRTFDELITLLSDYAGENGTFESAVETLSRLLEELEKYRRRGTLREEIVSPE